MDRTVNLFYLLAEKGHFVRVTHDRRFDGIYLKRTDRQILERLATAPTVRRAGLDFLPEGATFQSRALILASSSAGVAIPLISFPRLQAHLLV